MTDKEIIKALPQIKYGGCKGCTYGILSGDDRCGMKGCKIAREALDLIRRQQTEINHFAEVNKMVDETDKTEEVRVKCEEVINKIRAEAVREYSHKVIDYIYEICVMPDIAIEMVNGIDNLAKEFDKDINVRTNPEQVKGE